MPRFFVILLVLALLSYSIEHKVLKMPLKIHYSDNMQAIDSTTNLHSDPNNLELRSGNEEFEIRTRPNTNSVFYVTMWYPLDEYESERRFMLDTNSSRMAADLRGCFGCMGDISRIPKQFHN